MNTQSVLQFLRSEYMENKYREEKYGKNIEKGFKLFLSEHREYNTLGEYLESIEGKSISLCHLTLLMKEVVVRKLRVDFMLYSMQKHFKVSLPVLEGVATTQYWQKKLSTTV